MRSSSIGRAPGCHWQLEAEMLLEKPVKLGEPFNMAIPSQARKGRCRDLTAGTLARETKVMRKSRPQTERAAKAVVVSNQDVGGSSPPCAAFF